MSNVLGGTTGSFDQDGQLEEGSATYDKLKHKDISLRYLRFDSLLRSRIAEGFLRSRNGRNTACLLGILRSHWGKQDYDLQLILSGAAHTNSDNGTENPVPFAGLIQGQRVLVPKSLL